MTPISVLEQAAELGLKLGVEPCDTLTVRPASRCHSDFADLLRAHKWHLLVLLQLGFIMLDSEALGETIFFAENADTKACLVEAGAEPASIYTCDELRALVEQHRQQPFTVAVLLRLHEVRRMFGARVVQ
jgi:hypothetical protein